MNITFSEDRMPGQKVVDSMIRAGEAVAIEEGFDPSKIDVSVSFVSQEEIKELNGIYRGKNSVTDVLSFPQYEDDEPIPTDKPVLIGDVVICPEQALLQAEEYGHTGERELVYLFVHSLFHLLGYDHQEESDRLEMREMEEKIMKSIGLVRD